MNLTNVNKSMIMILRLINNFHTLLDSSKFLTNVSPTTIGNTNVTSAQTFTGFASYLILPHETASSGLAPASEPSYSLAVLIYTE